MTYCWDGMKFGQIDIMAMQMALIESILIQRHLQVPSISDFHTFLLITLSRLYLSEGMHCGVKASFSNILSFLYYLRDCKSQSDCIWSGQPYFAIK